MIDHSYSIITHEIPKLDSRNLSFVAKLSELCIDVDGLHIDNPYPNRACFGSTQVEAMISASDALRSWLKTKHAARSLVGSWVA